MEETYRGYSVKVIQDETPENPREWDNLGTMVCFHNRYTLGDKTSYKPSDYSSWEELKEAIVKEHGKCVILPLYLYDHSGLTVSTKPFSCPWDSGQIGYIFVPYSKVRNEWNKKRVSPALLKKIDEVLTGEVETYDKYLRGEVYGFVINKQDEVVESCFGFYDETEALNEAKALVDGR